MAFYKLFYIVHRRTDYYKLHRMIDERMYPEYYGALKQQAHNSIMRLAIIHGIIHGLGGHYW